MEAAEASSSSGRGKQREERDTKKPPRPVIAQACSACQKRKSKCDGKLPSCSQCVRKGTECKFDTDDLRRIANLRLRNQNLQDRLAEFEDLVTKLHQGSDEDAVDLLRNLRRSNALARAVSPPGSTTRDPSASPSDEGLSSPGTPLFRGSTWHPTLRIHVASRSILESSGRPRSISTGSVWRDPESPSSPNRPSPHVELFGNFATSTGIGGAPFSETVQLQQSHRVPIHFVQSSVVIEDSPLSRVYTDYRDAARQLIAGGAPLQDVMGSLEYINVDLYFRVRQNDPFSANFWACEALKSFDEFEHAERLGLIVLLTHLMRWTVHPTVESYDAVPNMIRPTPNQLMIPHVPAIDLVPIPAMRDALISNFRDWISITSETMHLEWPHAIEDSVEIDQATGCRRLTAKFEDFAKDPDHWTFDKDVLKVFPELDGKLSLRDDAFSSRESKPGSLE